MIAPQTIQAIYQRIDIVEVVGHFVTLKRRGTNYIGLCPFHGERTPSFMVSQSKGIFKCFGCGKGGSAINFLIEHEKLSYVEALRWIAHYYNITIEETAMTDEAKEYRSNAESLTIVNQFAQEHFSEQLNTDEGKAIALSYLIQRGLSTQSIQHFLLGYCSNEGKKFSNEALLKQYHKDILLKSGLSVLRNNEYIDNYKGRIIFPIQNHFGKIIGFGARIIGNADNSPKYINTPENEIYNKSQTLYGIYQAKDFIYKQNECFLVEGYTDVIAMHQAGIKNTVASGGTSVTKEQLQIIHKYTSNLTIIYDGDNAGIKATLRAINIALSEGMNVYVLLIPNNEDPDSFIVKNGKEQFDELLLHHKQDFLLFQLSMISKEHLNDPIKKNETIMQVAQTLSNFKRVEDIVKRQEYIKKCAELLDIDAEALNALVNTYIRKDIAQEKQVPSAEIVPPPTTDTKIENLILSSDEESEKSLLRILLENGYKKMDNNEQYVYEYIYNEIIPFREEFENNDLLAIIDLYKEAYESGKIKDEQDIKYFLYHPNTKIANQIVNILAQAKTEMLDTEWETKTGLYLQESFQKDLRSTITIFQLRKLRKLILKNQQDILENTDDSIDYLQAHIHLKNIEQNIAKTLNTVIRK